MDKIYRALFLSMLFASPLLGAESHLHKICRSKDSRQIKNAIEALQQQDPENFLAALNQQNELGETPVFLAISASREAAVQDILVPAGANLLIADNQGCTPLMMACQKPQKSSLIRYLLEQINPDSLTEYINKRDHYGKNALIYAMENHNLSIIENFLEKGVDITGIDQHGRTILLQGLIANYNLDLDSDSVIEANLSKNIHRSFHLLLEKCTDDQINKPDAEGVTPLIVACMTRDSSFVKKLLKKGAQCNVADNKGITPLMSACRRMHKETVDELLKHGAQATLEWFSAHGKTAFAITCEGPTKSYLYKIYDKTLHEAQLVIVEKLLSLGACYSHVDTFGNTPLVYACKSLNFDLSQRLLNLTLASQGLPSLPVRKAMTATLIEKSSSIRSACAYYTHPSMPTLITNLFDLLFSRGIITEDMLTLVSGKYSLLEAFCELNDLIRVQQLLYQGVSPEGSLNNSTTPLGMACRYNYPSIALALLNAGANPRKLCRSYFIHYNEYELPICTALESCKNEDEDTKALFDTFFQHGTTTRQFLTNEDRVLYIAQGKNFTFPENSFGDRGGDTLLHFAVRHKNKVAITAFLDLAKRKKEAQAALALVALQGNQLPMAVAQEPVAMNAHQESEAKRSRLTLKD